jgi:two-component system sensor histidine kinase DegS
MQLDTDFLSRLTTYVDEFNHELERAQTELREIDLNIRQSSAEVERLSQRNAQMRSQVARMESDLDNYARNEIRSTYNAERESQLRLFMMRSQVENLQGKQRQLEKYAHELGRILELVQLLPASDMSEPNGATGPMTTGAPVMARIIEAQENERLVLARNMHDGPAQSLTNLVLQAEICERLFDHDTSRARQELGNLRTSANSTFQKVRDFIFELRPMMLDDLGLAPTLRRYIATFEEKNRVGVHFALTGQERRLAPALEITIFRAVQELLNNAIHHAHASHVQVSLDLGTEVVTAVIEDNGSGFDPNEVMTGGRKSQTAVGLAALRERIEMLNGKITFDSSMGRGTRVTIEMPDIPA